MKKDILIFLGPPGSGKGTQASLISKKCNLLHLSTGDLLRTEIKQDTPLGHDAKKYIELGKLVPNSLIIEMILKRIDQKDCKHGYILDGFPRNIPQANALQTHLKNDLKHLLVVNFELNEEIIIERLSGRLTCSKCGQPYHLKYAPPKKPTICDFCHSPLIQRKDDTKDVIVHRIEVYNNETAPLVQFYSSLNLLKTINATQSPENLLKDLLKKIA